MAPFPLNLNLSSLYSAVVSNGNSALQAALNSSITLKEKLSNVPPDVNSVFSDVMVTVCAIMPYSYSSAFKGLPSIIAPAVNSSIAIKEQLFKAPLGADSLFSDVKNWFSHGPPSRITPAVQEAAQHSFEWFKTHREIFIVILIVLLVIVLSVAVPWLLVGIVHILGFGIMGIAKGSLAELYQAAVLGGTILEGSAFACMQSVGASGACPPGISALIILVVLGGVCSWLYYK
ncbi:hypothetical protein NEOLEDRAFT_1179654 [Neolentinus lepideus HHB14362 ss-1]|uniref:Uncharacterized protein n=1 Tax=Neolentinus lepideus HHB14362 ss-1 TaxID=1314782 RepID=A0A165RJC0_9AGAM|nr:hypothetical protein NEOLEDRAFT_1179654 [Neolentinus lepideus HHB14362 ss-1]